VFEGGYLKEIKIGVRNGRYYYPREVEKGPMTQCPTRDCK
jgi:hypothetical protein